MKVRTAYILIIAAVLGTGSAYLFLTGAQQPAPEAPPPQPQKDPVKTENRAVKTKVRKTVEPAPKPAEKNVLPPATPAVPPARKQPKAPSIDREAAARRFWDSQAQHFSRQQERLNREEDPARRLSLIRSMSRYVRINTPNAIAWAMSMVDPEEQRAALEAINQNALSGIGARIEMDETGIPKIKETTVLSAVAATGQVEPGDYIVGMEDGNGQPVYFEGLSVREVTRRLRGDPGTEVRLLMERAPDGANTSYLFDVTVQRSLLVVQPPF